MAKLSDAQLAVLVRLGEGWELGCGMNIEGRVALKKSLA